VTREQCDEKKPRFDAGLFVACKAGERSSGAKARDHL
jgi:hypothetical protein